MRAFFRVAGLNFLLAIVYYGCARLGLLLDLENGLASVVWPPAGIALAALLAGGLELWPGIFLGALVVDLSLGLFWPVAILIALSSTLEAVLATYILRRWDWHDALDRLVDVFQFAGVVLSCSFIGASLSSVLLHIGSGPHHTGRVFFVWWLGDAVGALVLVPFIRVWVRPIQREAHKLQQLEAITLAVCAFAVNLLVFFEPSGLSVFSSSRSFMLFPILLWATVRFGQYGAACAVVMTAATAITGALFDAGPFMGDVRNDNLLSMQMFLGIVVLSVLLLGAVIEERRLAIRLRDDFLFIAAHELKTPITALQLSLQNFARLVSRSGQTDERIQAKMEVANIQTQRLAKLIDDLLDVSRISGNKLTLQYSDVDLAAMTQDVVQRIDDQAQRAGCTVRARTTASACGRWDAERIEQVITNLMTNAIKYGAGKPIEVSVESDDTVARIHVKDEGIGIAVKDTARIFDRFERAVSSQHYGGLGLGLHIASQIVQAHGGAIRVHSALGEGSIFTVELPRNL